MKDVISSRGRTDYPLRLLVILQLRRHAIRVQFIRATCDCILKN